MLFPDHVHLFCRQIRINRRNHEQGQESSTYHPTDNGDPHSHPAFSTGTGSNSHRENTQNRRQTRHQNRLQPPHPTFVNGFQQRKSLLLKPDDRIDLQNFVHTAISIGSPIALRWLANSTIRIPFFDTSPINMITPIWLKIFIV